MDMHNPLGHKCHDTGATCSDEGIILKDTDGNSLDVSFFDEVKIEEDKKGMEYCVKFKDDKGGSKIEDEGCGDSKATTCYVHCGEESMYSSSLQIGTGRY